MCSSDLPVTAFGLEYLDPGVKAQDLIEGDVSDLVAVESNLDTTKLGTYEVQYFVKDKAGNPGEPVTRVVVVEDLVPPVIELIGGGKVFAIEGFKYRDLGAIALDDLDGDVTELLEVTSDVDASQPGRYKVSFIVTDSHGNQSLEVIREVTVRDSTPPVWELLGEPVVYLESGEVCESEGRRV